MGNFRWTTSPQEVEVCAGHIRERCSNCTSCIVDELNRQCEFYGTSKVDVSVNGESIEYRVIGVPDIFGVGKPYFGVDTERKTINIANAHNGDYANMVKNAKIHLSSY